METGGGKPRHTWSRKVGMRDEKAILAETKKVEAQIQRLLLDLCGRFDLRLEQVDVDTRNFANYRTQIIFETPQ